MFRKRNDRDGDNTASFEAMFEPFARLGREQLPPFEYYLLGAIADRVGKIGNRPVTERDASDVFSAVPQALALATSSRSGSLVPEWPEAPSPDLLRCRSEVLKAAPMVAASPQQFMSALMPALHGELQQYAGHRTGQIRSCWVWTMYCFVAVAQGRGADTTWAFPVLGAAVQTWASAAGAS